MTNFVNVNEDIGGETRRVAINMDLVAEVRIEDETSATFVFVGELVPTIAAIDDALRSDLARFGIVA